MSLGEHLGRIAQEVRRQEKEEILEKGDRMLELLLPKLEKAAGMGQSFFPLDNLLLGKIHRELGLCLRQVILLLEKQGLKVGQHMLSGQYRIMWHVPHPEEPTYDWARELLEEEERKEQAQTTGEVINPMTNEQFDALSAGRTNSIGPIQGPPLDEADRNRHNDLKTYLDEERMKEDN